MTQATNIITLALTTSGALGVGQTPQAQDLVDALYVLNDLIAQANRARIVQVIPGELDQFPDLTTDVPSWYGREDVLVWNLSCRVRPLFGMPEDEQQSKFAAQALALLNANNKQVQPAPVVATTDVTPAGLVFLALRAAGRITDTQGVAEGAQDATDGLLLLSEMIDEWRRDREVSATDNLLPDIGAADQPLAITAGLRSAIVWNLAVRMRSAFGQPADEMQVKQAERSKALLLANNRQFQAPAPLTTTDRNAYGLAFAALRASTRINDQQGVSPASQDMSDALLMLDAMWDEWQRDRAVTVTPGTFPSIDDPAAPLTISAGLRAASIWGLAIRLRSAFGIAADETQTALATKALAALQANNKHQVPALHPGQPATAAQVVFLALRMAGRINDQQSVADDSADVNDALSLLGSMLAQWSKQRWLVFNQVDVYARSTGELSYTIGRKGAFNLASRAERISSAFVRTPARPLPVTGDFDATDFSGEFLGGDTTNTDVLSVDRGAYDYPLQVISSREDYNAIRQKGLAGGMPGYVFLDTSYPLGTVYVWPQPALGQYEIHLNVKATLPEYVSLDDPLNVPPEYNEAMIQNLAVRLLLLTGGRPSQELQGMARASLQTIRKANVQIPLLRMPANLPGQRWSGGGGYGWGWGGFGVPTPVDPNNLTGADDGQQILGSDGQPLIGFGAAP